MRLTEEELGDGCAEAFAGPGDNDDFVWHDLEKLLGTESRVQVRDEEGPELLWEEEDFWVLISWRLLRLSIRGLGSVETCIALVCRWRGTNDAHSLVKLTLMPS